ncbi:hypothetical protein DPMN_113026 [Dreissena polymorpha]|uniref:Uncharacterized protein n=1 Tax=Dreissena polymorpha TaxID=45954 RepID=A0A9D4QQF6_DREPO|nr:hypothetical protein DPMN_113026 [Dreissena polymorpha]
MAPLVLLLPLETFRMVALLGTGLLRLRQVWRLLELGLRQMGLALALDSRLRVWLGVAILFTSRLILI